MSSTEAKGVPFAEYAEPIYKSWDARGEKPPEGYESWMAYLREEGWKKD